MRPSAPTPGVGTITLPGTYATGYRTLVFDPAAILAQSPDVTNTAEQCLQSASFDVTGGPREYWSGETGSTHTRANGI